MCLYIVHYFIAIYTQQKTTKIIKNVQLSKVRIIMYDLTANI